MNIYADHAATTKMSRRAIEVMLPYMDQIYGNPSSLHSYGQRGAEALQNAREQMAKVPERLPLSPEGAKRIIRLFYPRPGLERGRGKSILYPPPSSIMRYSTRWML